MVRASRPSAEEAVPRSAHSGLRTHPYRRSIKIKQQHHRWLCRRIIIPSRVLALAIKASDMSYSYFCNNRSAIGDDGDEATSWSAFEVLRIMNPETCSFSCVGYAKSKGRRCWNQIAQHNIASARRILESLPSRRLENGALRQVLAELAGLALCRRFHQDQIDQVTARWYCVVEDAQNRSFSTHGASRSTGSSTSRSSVRAQRSNTGRSPRDDGPSAETYTGSSRGWYSGRQYPEANRANSRSTTASTDGTSPRTGGVHTGDHTQEERDPDRTRQEDADARRQQEARTQAETERARQESDRRQRERLEQIRREEEEAARRAREQRARERAEAVQRKGDESWARYSRDWRNLRRIDVAHLDEDLRDTLPWPVLSGRWQDVDEASVSDFVKHAPGAVFKDSREFRKVVRKELLRWHPDKISQRFPTARDHDQVMRLATTVTRVVKRLLTETRD